jgi:hypothetical protein
MELSLCERATHMRREILKMEELLMTGRRVDLNLYINLVCCYSGLLSKIQPGLKRRARVVGSLAELLSQQEPTV